jgi:DNA repair photolyase
MLRLGGHGLLDDLGCGMTSVTPYALCDYKCVYCCTGVQGNSKPIMSTEDAVRELREHLASAPTPHIALFGALSDAYPNVEREIGMTRVLLAAALDAGARLTVITKGDIVLRDLDLLVTGARDLVNVQVSICCSDDEVLRELDPGAPSGTVRFGVIEELRLAGVTVGLNMLPWIPGITDTETLIQRVHPDVEVVVGPLSMGPDTDTKRVLGQAYRRQDVWDRYLEEYRRFGHYPNTSWIRPSPPPDENYPMYRMPVLDPPAASEPARA